MSLASSNPIKPSSRLIISLGFSMSSATGICTRPTKSLDVNTRSQVPIATYSAVILSLSQSIAATSSMAFTSSIVTSSIVVSS